IGTSAPQSLLELKSASSAFSALNISSTDTTGIYATATLNFNVGGNNSNYWSVQNDSTGFLKFRNTTGTTQMLINPNGGVAIGTMSQVNALEV
ncbi:hypothetical protein, partial [Enterococcus faecium]